MEQPDIHLEEDDPQFEPTMDVDEDIPNGTGTGNSFPMLKRFHKISKLTNHSFP